MIAVPLAVTAGPGGDCTDKGNKPCPVDTWAEDVDAKLADLEARVTVLEGGVVTPTTTTSPITTTTVPVTTTTIPTTTTTIPTPPPPTGDVDIYPGDSIQGAVNANPSGTIFIIKAGNHNVSTRINPKDGNQFLGEPGAILDGNNTTDQAFRASNNAKNVVVDGLTIEKFSSAAQAGAVAIGTGGGWTISNNEIRDNAAIGLVFNGPGNKILDNNVHHNDAMGIKGFGSGSLVEGNEIAFNNYRDLTTAGWEAGGTKFLETTNLILRDNWVHDNHDNGLWSDYNNVNVLYEDNLVEDNLGNGIFHELSYSATIRNNVVRNNGGRGIRVAQSSDVEVYGNTVTAPGAESAIWGSDTDRGSGRLGAFQVRNLWVHDNTFIQDTGKSGLRDNIGAGKVWNNNNRFDRNTWIVNSSNPFFWEGNNRKTWSQWQGYGHDLNGSIS